MLQDCDAASHAVQSALLTQTAAERSFLLCLIEDPLRRLQVPICHSLRSVSAVALLAVGKCDHGYGISAYRMEYTPISPRPISLGAVSITSEICGVHAPQISQILIVPRGSARLS